MTVRVSAIRPQPPLKAEHFESEVDGMVSLPLLFTQLFTISFQVHKSKS